MTMSWLEKWNFAIICCHYPTIIQEEEEGGEGTQQPDVRPTTDDFDNCEQLHESLSLAWTVNRTSESVQFMLCGCVGNDQAE